MNGPGKTYVIGASGYVGSALSSRLAGGGHTVEGTFNSNPSTGEIQFDFWSDDPSFVGDAGVVFAAFIEQDDYPIETFDRRVAELTSACPANRFVYLSSDAVFNGDAGPYSEDAPTSASTTYGQRTARFERIVRENCSNYCIVRPSYVYGYSGGVLDRRLSRTFRALRTGEQVAYYKDMYKSPVEVNQLAEIVCQVYRSNFCGTIHAGGPRMSVLQFHRRGAEAFGAPTDRIEPDEMPSDCPHPEDTSLDSGRLKREFDLQPGGVVESLSCGAVTDVLEG